MVSDLENDYIFFLPIDRIQTSTTTPGQSGPGTNGNEGEH